MPDVAKYTKNSPVICGCGLTGLFFIGKDIEYSLTSNILRREF
jgi:hypothetical protein